MEKIRGIHDRLRFALQMHVNAQLPVIVAPNDAQDILAIMQAATDYLDDPSDANQQRLAQALGRKD